MDEPVGPVRKQVAYASSRNRRSKFGCRFVRRSANRKLPIIGSTSAFVSHAFIGLAPHSSVEAHVLTIPPYLLPPKLRLFHPGNQTPTSSITHRDDLFR